MPAISYNRIPEPGEIDVKLTGTGSLILQIDISPSKPGGSITTSSIVVTVEGQTAFTSLTFQTGFDGPASAFISPIPNMPGNAHRVIIETDPNEITFTPGQIIDVIFDATDPTDPGPPASPSYSFTLEDFSVPTVQAVQAIEVNKIEVTFSKDVDKTTAETLANYTLAAVLDPELVKCVAEVQAVSVTLTSSNTVEIETDLWMTFLGDYSLTISGVTDEDGVLISPDPTTIAFLGFDPKFPEDRDFDLWGMVPRATREEDNSGTRDLRRWICVLQDCSDQFLLSIDRWVQIFDVDQAPEAFLDAMLADLGNPFSSFVLTETDKRRLIRVLVEIYKQKGLAKGIKNVARFFLGIEITIEPFAGDTDIWVLGVSELGIDTTLGTSNNRDLYTFNVISPVNLTDEERRRLLQIIDYMKPAHTHLGELEEPEIPEVFDHWELGISELGVNTDLH